MKQRRNRRVSFFLMLIFFLGLAPLGAAPAQADGPGADVGTFAELGAILASGGEIVLDRDYAAAQGEGSLELRANAALDLNGHTVDRRGVGGDVIQVLAGGALTLTDSVGGGRITGGDRGVFVGGGAFTMNGGMITGNTAAGSGCGVYVESGGFSVSGSPVIVGNGGSDLYLADGTTVTVTGALANGASIGVTMETAGAFAQADAGYNGGSLTSADAARFFSSDTAYGVVFDGGAAALSGAWTEVSSWAGLSSALLDGGLVRLTADAAASAADQSLLVPEGVTVTLDLNGRLIDRALAEPAEGGSVLRVLGSLTLTDGGTTPRYGCWNDSGQYVLTEEEPESDCDFIPAGGAIIGGFEDGIGAGGVFVGKGGTFTMNGGAICGNGAENDGGGVYVGKGDDNEAGAGGAFTMNDGTICGNLAADGGGVFVGGSGTFTMNGGAICGNSATDGGGVSVKSGICGEAAFTMTGGAVSGNIAEEVGGVRVVPYISGDDNIPGVFRVSGGPIVSGNTGDVSLAEGACVTVIGALTGDAYISISAQAGDTVAAAAAGYALTASDAVRFHSDADASITGILCEGGVTLAESGKLWVGGTDIVEAGGTVVGQTVDGVTGTAALTFDDQNMPVLTLTDYIYEGPGYEHAAVWCSGDLTVVGTGALTVTGGDSYDPCGAILCSGSLTVSGADTDLTAVGGTATHPNGLSCGVHADTMTVTGGARLTATSGAATESCGVFLTNDGAALSYGEAVLTVSGEDTVLTAAGGAATGNNGRSTGVRCAGVAVAQGAQLDADGGSAALTSYGIWCSGSVVAGEGGVLTARGGAATGANGNSCGIFCISGDVYAYEDGVLSAEGGTSNCDSIGISCVRRYSAGYQGGSVFASYGTLTCSGGAAGSRSIGVLCNSLAAYGCELEAFGGASDQESFGVYSDDGGQYAVHVSEGGSLTACGGEASDSYGVRCSGGSVNVEEGTAELIGGSYGVWSAEAEVDDDGDTGTPGVLCGGDVLIGTDGALTAAGAAQAIVGSVNNDVAGAGYASADGSGAGTEIAVPAGADGQELTYKRVVFPAPAPGAVSVTIDSVSGDGSTVTYTVTGAPAGARLIAARYDGGRLTSVRMTTDFTGSIVLGGSGSVYRLMLVDENYAPLCEAATWAVD